MREAFAAALFRSARTPTPPTTPSSTRRSQLLQEQKPLVRTYTTDDIGVLSTGDAWVAHAWGSDVYQVVTERPTVKFYIPEEGGIRGSDTAVLLAGAQHPIAAQLFMNHLLDAQVAAEEHELHRLHGPQRRRQAVHRPGHPRGPDRQPGPGGRSTRWSSCSTSAPTSTSTPSRWTTLRAGASAASGAGPLVLPGIGLAGPVLPACRWRSSSSSAWARRTGSAAVQLDHLTLDNYASALSPTFLPDGLELVPVRAR